MPRAKRVATEPESAPAAAELPAAVWEDPNRLKPWEGNPRENEHAIEPVVRSIKAFGFGAPILARKKNREIIAGHTRWKAALRLELDRVPVRYLDVTEKQAHQLALADNRLGELATWNDDELLALLQSYAPDEQLVAGWSEADMKALERAVVGEPDGELPGENGFEHGSKFGVIVMADSEQSQEEIFNRLTELGYSCRVVSV